jgi:hypothetical protein
LKQLQVAAVGLEELGLLIRKLLLGERHQQGRRGVCRLLQDRWRSLGGRFDRYDRSRLGCALLGHCEFGSSVLAKHLSGEMWFVSEEELVIISSEFGSARDAYKVPIIRAKERNMTK